VLLQGQAARRMRAGRPEPALVRLTPDSVSEALHGGGVVVHVSSPLSV